MIKAPFTLPKTLVESNALVLEMRFVIEKLQLQIATLKRARFGSSSEAIDSIVDQMELTLEVVKNEVPKALPELPSWPVVARMSAMLSVKVTVNRTPPSVSV